MDETSMKQREADGGDGGTKGGEKTGQKSARPKNTVSRIDGGKGLNTPKTVSSKPATSQSDLENGAKSGSSTESTEEDESKTEEAAPRPAPARPLSVVPRSSPTDPTRGKLNGLRVAILATHGFEVAELIKPRKALEEAGARTTVIAPKAGSLQGFNHDEKGEEVSADLDLASAEAGEFDAVLLPGGALNADALRVNQDAQRFVQEIDRAGKPIAVICHAPWLLISAGLTRGRKMTSYHTIKDDVRNSGATWEDREALRERNWVSSRQPDDIPAFNREMISLFAERQAIGKTATVR
ncbi:MAG: type 1 glutamine amidotransferase domain-containing protein [Candidatus Acidiferrum sp.]|jgi:protease I